MQSFNFSHRTTTHRFWYLDANRIRLCSYPIKNSCCQFWTTSACHWKPLLLRSDFKMRCHLQALHWTPLPQPDEAQITFKIVFPQSCLTRSELFEVVKRISNVYRWQYQYEWSHGVLFRIEAVCFEVKNLQIK